MLTDDPFIATCEDCHATYGNLGNSTTIDPWTGHELQDTTTEEQRRSPNPVTPYDDPHTLWQRLVWPDRRRLWLRGYFSAQDAE